MKVICSLRVTTLVFHVLFTKVFHMKLLHYVGTYFIGNKYWNFWIETYFNFEYEGVHKTFWRGNQWKKQRLYGCRKEDCRLKYTLSPNWNRHEKPAGHMPLKRSEVIEAFYDVHLKLFKCTFPDYQVTSKRKSNLKRHIKSCETQKKKKIGK